MELFDFLFIYRNQECPYTEISFRKQNSGVRKVEIHWCISVWRTCVVVVKVKRKRSPRAEALLPREDAGEHRHTVCRNTSSTQRDQRSETRSDGWIEHFFSYQRNDSLKHENLLQCTHTQYIIQMFLHQIWRNVALHQCLINGCSAVNGCRQNESLIKTSHTPVHQLTSGEVKRNFQIVASGWNCNETWDVRIHLQGFIRRRGGKRAWVKQVYIYIWQDKE